jgi:hypothetical protein
VSEDLAELLGCPPPAGVAALGPNELAVLARVIADARHQQACDLAASFETTLKHVPFPLRVLVRKVLVG